MSTTDAESYAQRPPKQERSRAAWNRALDVGLTLLESGGLDAVTITEVCRRGRISPPSLYARVAGRAGLIAAVYERGMARVRASEDAVVASLDTSGTPEERVSGAIAAMTDVFTREQAVLRAVIASSTRDERIHARGVEEARRVQDRILGMIALPTAAGRDIAAMIFAELVFRTAYGGEFTAVHAESEPAFVARLTRMSLARAHA